MDPAPALAKFNAATLEDLQVLVALGDVGAHQVARVLAEHERARTEPREAEPAPVVRTSQRGVAAAPGFTVVGLGNLLAQPARCCQPLPGEPVVLPVEWGRRGSGAESDVVIDAVDRKWLLKDVSNLIAQEDAHVLAIQSEARKGGQVRLRLRLRVADFGQLSRLLARLDGLPGVEQVRRA
jgi:GTP pyrophosphokinase